MSGLTRYVSQRRQRHLSYAMEVCLVGLLVVGIVTGSVGVIVNTVVALAVIQLPALLQRDYKLPMDPRLTLWITSAAFFHAVGLVGIPWTDVNFYSEVWWWDHVTHALSASVVAAVGYATVRAVDKHSEEVYLPPAFISVLVLVFVLAFGVLWELLEFGVGIIAESFGTTEVLTQYGAEDTLMDLVFNTLGGIVVAIWGGVYLTDLSDAITDQLDKR
ncbi:hypothetical protein [Natronococcus wangiae]|uniref:hypothetical protein n=1 Tax=Natronococcus wangiae TaxID=3068275 RepID=UPI00273F1309|nr:hypothetical protein [Natronococcus sp. AD5]